MRVKVRTTLNGTEYWDTKEQRSVFVPKDGEPSFEVTENPSTMLEITDKAIKDNEQTEVFIEDMTAKQMRAYAEESNITIPFEIKKTEDIRKFLLEYQELDEDGEGTEE